MKILLLGATGRTGKLALTYALGKGYKVNCLVRDQSKLQEHEKLSVLQGIPTNPADLEKAMEGCKSIINILNISRKNDFPWSPLRTPRTLLSDTTRQLIDLAKANSISRVVSCSAWGVGDSRAEIPVWFRWMIDNSNIGKAYHDHEKQEELLKTSELDFTIVRPSGLINTKRPMKIQESYSGTPKPTLTISRMANAQFLVDSITRKDLEGKTVTISKSV